MIKEDLQDVVSRALQSPDDDLLQPRRKLRRREVGSLVHVSRVVERDLAKIQVHTLRLQLSSESGINQSVSCRQKKTGSGNNAAAAMTMTITNLFEMDVEIGSHIFEPQERGIGKGLLRQRQRLLERLLRQKLDGRLKRLRLGAPFGVRLFAFLRIGAITGTGTQLGLMPSMASENECK